MQFRGLRNHILCICPGCGEVAVLCRTASPAGGWSALSHPTCLWHLCLCSVLILPPKSKMSFPVPPRVKILHFFMAHLKICLLPILIPLHSTVSLIINYSNLCYITIHSIPPYICIFIVLLLCRYFLHYLVFLAEQGDLQRKENCLGFSCLSAPHRS